MCQHNLPCSIVYAHCLLPGRAFASLYVLLFLEKEAEIGGRDNSSKRDAIGQGSFIYYECLRNGLRSLEIYLINVINAYERL